MHRKTQIALQYAYNRCRDPDCSVFWVHADTEATFTQDYKTIAGVLGLGSRLEGSELLGAVRRGIESQKRWVLIVDNADDLGLFGVGQTSGKQQGALLDSIPKGLNGTVLWTSRDQRVDGSLVGPQRGIQVTKMTVKESRKLLEKWRRQVTPSEEVRGVELLLEELQWLPLAISQAGAYLYRTDTSVSEYLSQLKRETGRWRVLGEDEFDRHRRGDAQNSVLRTWAISIRRLKQESQTAYRILHVLAFVDNQNIPMKLLAAAAKYRQKAQTAKPRQRERTRKKVVRRLKDFSFRSTSPNPEEQVKKEDPDDPDGLGRAVRRLKDFSFMTEHRGEGNRRTFEMHKLVQDAARYGLKAQQSPGQDEGYFARVALRVVDSVYPQDTLHNNKTQGDCERYLAHALRVCDWAEIHGMEKGPYYLQVRICNFLYSRGRYEEYFLASETRLRLVQKAFGERHWKSIWALQGLGWAFNYLRQFQEAEGCANKAVALAQEIFGDKDELTLQCKRLLAAVDSYRGRFEQAKQLFIEALDHARQFLDEDHHIILGCTYDLARTHIDLKEYDEAGKLLPRLLKLRQDQYGQSHPDTLLVLHLLGNLHYKQRRYDDAVKSFSFLLDLERQSLGNEHPNTLTAIHNLAESQRLRGQKEEAVELMQECSRLHHKVLGADHPHTTYVDIILEEWEHEDMGLNS
jgi:tetratricopeptide (TPR) repeat protein